jgi:hypothetical protein
MPGCAALLHGGVPPSAGPCGPCFILTGRIHRLSLFPHLLRLPPGKGRARLAEAECSPVANRVVPTGPHVIDHLDHQLEPVGRQLITVATEQLGCQALTSPYGVAISRPWPSGPRRGRPIGYAGLDITVRDLDGKRLLRALSRQGPPPPRLRPAEAPGLLPEPAAGGGVAWLSTRVVSTSSRLCRGCPG